MIENISELKVMGDDRGKLSVIEGGIDVPFDIKRVFYIYDVNTSATRGAHAHYKTKQFLVPVSGRCKVTLDNGQEKHTFELNKPNICLFQDAMIWGTMHDFSDDCVLMILADDHYDDSDYIRNYNKFLEVAKNDS